MRVLISGILSVLISSAVCGQSLDELKWILGDWELIENGIITSESWSRHDDSTFVGSSLTIQGDKTLFEEGLRIEVQNNEIVYLALLPDKTGYFKLTNLNGQHAVFEDPENDFPYKIVYEMNDTMLEITLFGIQNGEKRSMKMSFSKK